MALYTKGDSVAFDTLNAQVQQVIEQIKTSKRPLVIMREGGPAAVLIDAADYEWQQKRSALMEQIAQAKVDISEGRFYTEEEVDAILDAGEEQNTVKNLLP